ncbi:MAG: molybdopterin-dependent oxidoreductase [Bacteroidota bacterium]
MPHIYIDGKRIETQSGKTIIEAAYDNGLYVPHFCWHPELSVAGNCRMCLVEVGLPKRLPNGEFETDSNGNIIVSYMPKLQIACATQVADGMHVRINHDKVIKAQEAVMEFLLINHPLDCPICDEAGQCKLQEYAFNHSRGESRFEETKNHKDKRVSWGPNVLFDAERCISCSRCIRFAKEIAKQDVLSFVQRGDHVTIKVQDGAKFDNNYSMNVIDICPVGALTSPDFRFKSRVWDMSFNDSICMGCSRGCNIQIGVRNNEILRIEPKTNMYVNKYWMCDYGRLSYYKKINENRVVSPTVKKNGTQTEVSWDEAISTAASILRKYKPSEMMFIGSGRSSTENNYALARFAKNVAKSVNLDFYERIEQSFADDFLRTNDLNPNSAGCRSVGVAPTSDKFSLKKLSENITNGSIKLIYIMDEDFDLEDKYIQALQKAEAIIIHSTNHSKLTEIADVVFASSYFAESEGTFINIDNRVQYFEPALVTTENLHRMGMKMSRLDKFGAANDRWTQKELRNCRPAWKVLSLLASHFSVNFNYNKSEDVFNDIAHNVGSFNGMSYRLLKKHQGIILGKSSNPDPVLHNYESHYMKPN